MRWTHCSLLVVLLAVSAAPAEVSLKNGNFFTGSTDIQYPGGFEMKIERVYNSKMAFKGWFGNGWGTESEAYLQLGGDGSLTAHEYGGGASNVFVPPAMSSAEIEGAADTIVAAAADQGDVTGEAPRAAYKAKLVNDAMFRSDEWQKYIGKGGAAGAVAAGGHTADEPAVQLPDQSCGAERIPAELRQWPDRVFSSRRPPARGCRQEWELDPPELRCARPDPDAG
jgi:hypothetical protein